MIDKYELIKEILRLVDSQPLTNIDMAPIIVSNSVNLTFEEKRTLRLMIVNILRELRKNEQIEFYDGNLMIHMHESGVFIADGCLIRGTYKRLIENEKNNKTANTKKIQLATRRNILDGFSITRISWHGDMDQPSFLGRLYDLSVLPSYDPRYKTANEDIYKHTVMNDDWPEEWVFTDNRFNILHTSDNIFLDFLCMTIHPTVRQNSEELTTLLEIYINNLKRDGFTISKVGEIAGYSASEIDLVINIPTTIVKKEIRKALVIGCSFYQYATPLTNPNNDANGMESILQTLGFEVVKKIDPTQKALKIAIDEFGEKLKGSDVGLFYFAGHGVQVKGLNYLIPVDANLKSEMMVEYDCVEAGRVLVNMENARVSVNIVILDACRNNPFERNWGRGVGQRGLATMNAPKGSLIAYSTAPGSTASDGLRNNGLYTETLLNYIGNKTIPINTMFQKVRLKVMEESKEEQIPWEATSLTADFYFNK